MDSRKWQAILNHFDTIANLPAKDREQALTSLAADDASMAKEVRSLLASDDPDFLAEPAFTNLSHDLPDDPELPAGSEVGPYRITETLGEGGMGIVYLADRVDEQFQRLVALKIIKRGMDTHRVIRHFQAERQILASLTHPNIALLYDGGMSDDGVPYFSMEYVDGLPIDTYCEQNDLPLTQRLKLLCEACAAVQYAHRNLVVHRDLKPSNVLVTSEGQVKLLDFGIATLLDDRTGAQEQQTLMGRRALTPNYASPEQVRGEPMTTAADIWSLGILLNVMLTGKCPNDLTEVPLHQLATVMKDLPPPKPSSASVPWARKLRGDLDTIVQVAMHPDPARRYPTADALAEDLRDHLAGRPISARRDNVGYRARRFIQRNRLVVGATVATFAVLLGFALAMGRQAKEIEHQNTEIVLQRDRAEEVTAVLVDMFDVSDPINGSVARGDTLRVLDFLRMNEERLTTELGDQPDLNATFCHLLSRLYGNLGHYDRALILVRKSLSIRKSITKPPDPELARELDYLGTILDQMGKSAEAEMHIRNALDMRRQLFQAPHADIAESLNNLAWSLSNQDRDEESLPLDREALAMRRALPGDHRTEIAQSLNNLASSLLYLDRLEEAEPLFREALEVRQAILGRDHPSVANTMNNLGRLLFDLGNLAAADSLLSGAIDVWTRSIGPNYPRISAGLVNLSLVAEEQRDLERAISSMARALEIDSAALPADHPFVALDHLELGRLNLGAGRINEALGHLRQAHSFYLENAGPDGEETRRAAELIEQAEERNDS
ncbi:MAG: serine/threonine protein kinase [bacterium]|nr:serine/threonine protein kinase [bacterium]